MKKTFKTIDIVVAFKVLNEANYSEMEETASIAVWKIARALKPIATKFEDDNKDAAEKFKPKSKDFEEKLQKFYEYNAMVMNQSADMKKLPMGAAEYQQFSFEVIKPYNEKVKKATDEFAEADVTVEFEPVSEEVFGKLMASNKNWKMSQAMAVADIITK